MVEVVPAGTAAEIGRGVNVPIVSFVGTWDADDGIDLRGDDCSGWESRTRVNTSPWEVNTTAYSPLRLNLTCSSLPKLVSPMISSSSLSATTSSVLLFPDMLLLC